MHKCNNGPPTADVEQQAFTLTGSTITLPMQHHKAKTSKILKMKDRRL